MSSLDSAHLAALQQGTEYPTADAADQFYQCHCMNAEQGGALIQ